MKKDKLEQFVQDHAGGFDALEPPVMAWDAIEKALPVSRKSTVRRLWPYAWKVAAAVLIFASAWMLNDFNDQRKQAGNYAVSGDSSSNPALNELSDAEAFYATQISSRQAELAAYTRQHPEIIEDLKREFSEMDKKKDALKDDLAESNADEKVIEAIILSYRVKLEILDQMLTEMKRPGNTGQPAKPVQTEL